jgi:hypothetical protein
MTTMVKTPMTILGLGVDMKKTCVLVIVVVILTSGCFSWQKWPHENFIYNYSRQVGKRADDPFSIIVRYSKDITSERIVSNGNREIEYIHSSPYKNHSGCKVFFEIDSNTNIIVAWRYEGDNESCSWNP